MTIASTLSAAEQRAQYDAACKRLLSEKIILAWIMRGCLEEYHDIPADVIAARYIEGTPQVSEVPVLPEETNAPSRIRGVATEDASITEGTVLYDIRFLATAPGDDGLIELIVNVEAQNAFDPGYPLIKRALYYCSRMISAQYGTEFTRSAYEKIKKVCSIWICTDPPQYRADSIARYHLVEEALVGRTGEPVANYDLISVVMVSLGEHSAGHSNDLLHMLGTLLSNAATAEEKERVLATDFHIPIYERLKGDVSGMCNLSKGLEERSFQRGLHQGEHRGELRGKEKNLLENLHSVMRKLGMGPEQAMDFLDVPEEDRPRLRELLSQ